MRVATLAWFALSLAGCGTVSASGGDAGDDDGGVDAQTDAEPPAADAAPDSGPPACVWSLPTPDAFAADNSEASEEWPTLSGDGLLVFFTSAPVDGTAAPDIFDAGRDSIDVPFGSSRLVSELAGSPGEYEIEVSADASELFFLSDANATDEIQTTARPFGEVRTTGLRGFSPSVSADGLALYFLDLDRATILRSTRSSIDAAWGAPETQGKATGFQWIDVSADQLSLLLSGGDPSQASIAIARRQGVEDPWGEPVSAGDVFAGEDLVHLGKASWDGSGRQMAVSAAVLGGASDLYLSTCEDPGPESAATRSTE